MFATVVKAPAGLGKTREVLRQVALSLETPVEVYVPSHRLAEECQDVLLDFNRNKRVQIIQGRGALVGPQQTTLCAKNVLADELTAAGASVFPALCRRSQGQGPALKCQYYNSCGYINQFRHADVYLYTHAHLGLDRGPLETWQPSKVIIDESPFMGLLQTVKMPISLLTHHALPLQAKRLCADVAASLSTGQCMQSRFHSAQLSGELAGALEALEVVAPLSPALTDLQHRAVLASFTSFGRVRVLLQNLAATLQVRSTSQSVLYDAASGELVVQHRRPIKRFDRKDGSQPKIVLLDAGASKLIVEQFFDVDGLLDIAIRRKAYVLQCSSVRCSKTSLVPALNSDAQSKADASRRLREIDELIIRESAGGKKVLVVGPAAVVGNPNAGTPPLIVAPANCELAHFGGLRGIDRWKNGDVVIIIGRNEPPVSAVEDIGRALFYDDPTALDLPGKWSVKSRGYRLARRALGVDADVHRDDRIQAVVEQIREQETLQAIDRLRLIHCKFKKKVIVLSNLPLDLDVDELRTWEELMHGTRLERAWQASGGVLPLDPAWLAADKARGWVTAAAAKKDVSRAPKRGQFPNIDSIRKMSLFGFEYKTAGQRRWSKCLSSFAAVRRLERDLGKLVGKVVTVRRGSKVKLS